MTSLFTIETLYMGTGIALFALGLFALINYRHLLRQILAVNIMGSAVFMILIAAANRGAGAPDPVPHAMVLTGIVVAVSATTLALTIAAHVRRTSGKAVLPDDETL